MSKKIVLTGAIFIAISIILGAMAAHALEEKISDDLIVTFEKGVKYQLYMGLGLLTIGLNTDKIKFSLQSFFVLSIVGVFLFSGNIYLYSFHEILPWLKPAVYIVPFGGIAMILAWTILIIQFIKQK